MYGYEEKTQRSESFQAYKFQKNTIISKKEKIQQIQPSKGKKKRNSSKEMKNKPFT
jgi:hypothetical protein